MPGREREREESHDTHGGSSWDRWRNAVTCSRCTWRSLELCFVGRQYGTRRRSIPITIDGRVWRSRGPQMRDVKSKNTPIWIATTIVWCRVENLDTKIPEISIRVGTLLSNVNINRRTTVAIVQKSDFKVLHSFVRFILVEKKSISAFLLFESFPALNWRFYISFCKRNLIDYSTNVYRYV